MFGRLFSFVQKSFKEAVCSNIKTKSSVDDLENAQMKKPSNSRPPPSKSIFVIVFFLFIVSNISILRSAVLLFSNRAQKASKCGKNISDTLGYRLVCHGFVKHMPERSFVCCSSALQQAVNPSSLSIHIQILLTDAHIFPKRIS